MFRSRLQRAGVAEQGTRVSWVSNRYSYLTTKDGDLFLASVKQRLDGPELWETSSPARHRRLGRSVALILDPKRKSIAGLLVRHGGEDTTKADAATDAGTAYADAGCLPSRTLSGALHLRHKIPFKLSQSESAWRDLQEAHAPRPVARVAAGPESV